MISPFLDYMFFSIFTSRLTLIICLLNVLPAYALKGISELLRNGDENLVYPIAAGCIFLAVSLVAAIFEFSIDYASSIENKYFHVMYRTMSEELIIVGILSLSIKFGEGIISFLPVRYLVIFEWAYITLFMMTATFFVIILSVLGLTAFTNKGWENFEREEIHKEVHELSGRSQLYKKSYHMFLRSMEAYGFSARDGVRYHHYILKMQRHNIVELTDITWRSWLYLSLLVIFNAFRTRVTPTRGEDPLTGLPQLDVRDRLFNYTSFILCCGYGILGIFLICHFWLQRRLNQLLFHSTSTETVDALSTTLLQKKEQQATKHDLPDPLAYLFWQSKERTLEILQMVIIFFEWYISVFFLSFTASIIKYAPVYAAPLIISALIPCVILIVLLPWTLTTVTIMSSIGSAFDCDVFSSLSELKAEESREIEMKSY